MKLNAVIGSGSLSFSRRPVTNCNARPVALCSFAGLLLFSALLSGCSTDFANSVPAGSKSVRLSGGVHGGEQPISGAQIALYAAGTGGYGTAARPVLATPVTTDAHGNFSITGDYTCQPGDQVYLLATGGNPGLSGTANNSSIALSAALGSCSALTSSTFINVNEVTTIAAAYALAGFMGAPTRLSSSGTPLAITAMGNAFLSAANLADISTGTANAATPGGNGTVPIAEVNSLANILSACVNSSGSGTPCSMLFAATTPPGGTAPADTFTAAMNIAHSPGTNVGSLYGLTTAASPFQPSLSIAPHDWSLAITYTGGGIGNVTNVTNPLQGTYPMSLNRGLAVDGIGNVWVVNLQGVSIFNPAGAPLSPSTGFSAGLTPADGEYTIAIDPANNAWLVAATLQTSQSFRQTATNFRLLKMNSAGTLLSPAGGYTGGGLGVAGSVAPMTFDSLGNLWIPSNASGSAVAEFTANGVPLSPASGYASPTNDTIFGPTLTADTAGNVSWDGTVFGPGGTVVGRNCGNLSSATDAIDANGNTWGLNFEDNQGSPFYEGVFECSPTGTVLSSGYPVNLGDAYIDGSATTGVSIDGSNHILTFSPNFGGRLGVLDAAGTMISPAGGYQMLNDTGVRANFMALDASGNAWIMDNGPDLVEFVGIATPVVTPLASALATNKLGVRP